jgi:hypothetical protein
MAKLGQRAFARHIGVTLRAVQKAIATGRIKVDEEGKIDADSAALAWNRNVDESRRSFTDLSRQANKPAPGSSVGASSAAADADSDEDDEDDAELPDGQGEDPALASYRYARAEREQVRLERDRIELEQLRGSVIELAEAERMGFTALRTVRDAVLNVPVRVKDIIAAETDSARIEAVLADELTNALNAIDLAAIMRDDDPEDEDGS